MTKLLFFFDLKKNGLLLFLVSAIAVASFNVPTERILKRDREIDRIKEHDYRIERCVQYALVVSKDGWFTCYNCPSGKIYMYVGEIWKYGKTCTGVSVRYPNGFPHPFLTFQAQFYGTEKECLIEEKRKIYSYPTLPESEKRKFILLRPPGNKIDR